MYEVRHGAENLNEVKKKDFHLVDDKVYEFKYGKKVVIRFFVLLLFPVFPLDAL